MKQLIFCLTLTLVLLLPIETARAGDTKRLVGSEVKARIIALFPPGTPLTFSYVDETLIQVVQDTKVYFASHDGKYLFVDRVLDIANRRDLTEAKSQQIRQDILAELPDAMQLSFPAKGQAKQSITVFTDIDCPYCRQLHDRVALLNERGVEVNYVMLPRAGVNSPSFQKAVSAVCAPNPQQAMTQAMSGQTIETRECDNTIAEQLKLARRLGIGSTPVTILPSGEKRVGLYSVDDMLAMLQL